MEDEDETRRKTQSYERLYPRLYRALAATLLDAELAADSVQEAFLESIERPPADDRNIGGWLFRVALRHARRDWRRSFSARLAAPARDDKAQSELDNAIDRVAVGELLRLLSERQRAIVVAYYYLDLRQEDIAVLLGIKRGTVAATLAQALGRMRQGGEHA